MERDPSIHITRSQFGDILDYLDIHDFPTAAFFTIARKKSINSRAVIVNNKKDTKRVNNTLLANAGDANLVADIIYATRIKLKHRGVRKYTQSDIKNWALCKKVAEACNIFCNDFQLEAREGYIKYIELGIDRLNGNCRNLLNRLPAMLEVISSSYVAKSEWLNLTRMDRECCIEIQKHYVKRIADTTGIYETLDKYPEKMVHFLHLYRLCQENKWPPKQFIDAQFDSLSWCNGLPDIAQLYTDKAIERYNKYLFKINSRNKQQPTEESLPKIKGSIWETINS